MNAKLLKLHDVPGISEHRKPVLKTLEPVALFICLVLVWFLIPRYFQNNDPTIGMVDQSLWVLVILSMVSFLMICALSWWLLKHFWTTTGLPNINHIVSQFNTLTSWQQLSFFWGSFALLLLVAMGCVLAIC